MTKWKYAVDVVGTFGTGFRVLIGEVESSSENGAKKKIRRMLKKQGLRTYRASKHPISLTP